MSDKVEITYKDIASFYADKADTDEITERGEEYGNVARCIWFANLNKGMIFSKYKDKVNEEIGSKKIPLRITKKNPKDEKNWRSFGWDNKIYYVHRSADDYVFAWLVVNKIQKKKDGKEEEWDIVSIYNQFRGECQEFYEWFVNRCNPIEGIFYKPGQKWHLYEFLLYSEMNKIHEFSFTDKIDVQESIYGFKKDKYEKKCGNRLFTNTKFPPLWRWMFDQTIVELKDKKQKIEEAVLWAKNNA